jgi:hypothetical protein
MLSSFRSIGRHGAALCLFAGLTVSSSVFTIAILSADRLLAIRRPMSFRIYRAGRHAWVIVAVVWIASIAVASPLLNVRQLDVVTLPLPSIEPLVFCHEVKIFAQSLSSDEFTQPLTSPDLFLRSFSVELGTINRFNYRKTIALCENVIPAWLDKNAGVHHVHARSQACIFIFIHSNEHLRLVLKAYELFEVLRPFEAAHLRMERQAQFTCISQQSAVI